MRLAPFILTHRNEILDAWDAYAASLMPAIEGKKELRDHAEWMLTEIAADICTQQTSRQSVDKSLGRAPKSNVDTASETHAASRLKSGFDVNQLVAEYRALRASVLLLWSKLPEQVTECRAEDTLRFNEAIDMGLAEAVARYSQLVDESHDIFLGVLGHDLRTPLGAILLSAEFFLNYSEPGSRNVRVAEGIRTSVRHTEKIMENLLDMCRARVGSGIPLNRTEDDLTSMCEGIIREIRTFHPGCDIVFHADRRIIGQFDNSRLGQVFTNLIENAIKHGSNTVPITVNQRVEGNTGIFSIHNAGEPIAEESLERIFQPMLRQSQFASRDHAALGGLGLGLYIAQEIVQAHGGTIKVTSSLDEGTTFRVRLPLRLVATHAN